MSKFLPPALVLLAVFLFAGCLGERYEANVPAADLHLWDKNQQDSELGRPRFRGGMAPGNTLPNSSTLPGSFQGTLPARGTLPNGRPDAFGNSSLPGNTSLPFRGRVVPGPRGSTLPNHSGN